MYMIIFQFDFNSKHRELASAIETPMTHRNIRILLIQLHEFVSIGKPIHVSNTFGSLSRVLRLTTTLLHGLLTC